MNRRNFIRNGLIGTARVTALASRMRLLALGIIEEYLSQIFHGTKRRPIYIVDELNGERVIYRHGIFTERDVLK